MSASPTNLAARIHRKHGQLVVESAPYTHPGPGQIVVRNHAVAINPLDWIIQVEGNLLYGWLKYLTVLGTDVAGEVVELGEGVTRFSVGDRVFGLAVGTDRDTNTGSEGAFQQYTIVGERVTSRIPDSMSFEEASVLPMAVSTAAAGLFQEDYLGLQLPTAEARPTGKTVLVWGGSTSVGSNAIQLAVAAGYEVITTASPKNFDYVKSLGASQVFDYNSPTVIPDIVTALADRTVAGAVSFGTTGAPACVKIMAKTRGKKFVSIATPPVDFASLADPERGRLQRARVTIRLIAANIALQVSARPHGVGLKYIFGTDIKNNKVSTAIFRDFLPAALAEGRYTATPKPTIVGHAVSDFQHAMDLQRAGVSATKLVVLLDQVS
ncbi:zinc-binding alcohol dehydrogenase family protein [Cryobacterium lactosi]|uniref:Zinc-binding alcohol dehydrogenase family protein n=1 Tax=Cryobacterium lactosi TaxID=1259202 RepID=A0A4R9BNP9_9MICO|nr:zinc-binding alcohol dehydrogenase family protein [Cryobacterium lactosi]TFD86995.1 zinc-binding alcohol dehydrogenase family protein [Cryobacterium lactosi]